MRYLTLLILMSFWTSAFAQDIQPILDRDPFDPNRGQAEDATQVLEPGEEPVTPVDLPILDGTIIAGGTRIAIFSFILEGKPASARVTVNDKVAQYTVLGIERHRVELSSGAGEPIQVALYSGTKEKRGGSKVPPKPKPKPAAKPKPLPNGNGDDKGVKKNDSDNKTRALQPVKKNNDRKFNQRRPPRQPRSNKVEEAKRRF